MPHLTQKQMVTRKKFAIWWRKSRASVKGVRLAEKQFMFSDEKKFEIDGGFIQQNDRVYARSRAEANKNGGLRGKSKYPLSVMVWASMTNYGLILHFVDEKTNIDSNYYCKKFLSLAKKEGLYFCFNISYLILALINSFSKR